MCGLHDITPIQDPRPRIAPRAAEDLSMGWKRGRAVVALLGHITEEAELPLSSGAFNSHLRIFLYFSLSFHRGLSSCLAASLQSTHLAQRALL
jgi:hypothetical protein